jgi:hypothetical protein
LRAWEKSIQSVHAHRLGFVLFLVGYHGYYDYGLGFWRGFEVGLLGFLLFAVVCPEHGPSDYPEDYCDW